ncbi:MAG: cupin-like domain-containing protein [Saprospiraceae bacterium]|nr:cupin-like domain-containing protein [Saprospiraceae bacterium]
MKLFKIERRSGLGPEEFKKEYLSRKRPVVLTDFAKDWPATEKWTFDFLRAEYGHIEVPLFDKKFSEPGKTYMTPTMKMKFGDYLTLIENEPTELRMFLFNIFRHAPELVSDVRRPTIMKGFLNEYPFMFFGGMGSSVKMHYDIDCSNVFLTQFQTRKKITLFSPDQSKFLYHLPFTVASLVDMEEPDIEKYPALKKVRGWETVIGHGETIFIPSMYWHFIEYIDGGFSLALRSTGSLTHRIKGALNIARHFVVDRGMNKVLGTRWHSYKKELAYKRAGV